MAKKGGEPFEKDVENYCVASYGPFGRSSLAVNFDLPVRSVRRVILVEKEATFTLPDKTTLQGEVLKDTHTFSYYFGPVKPRKK